MTDDSERDRMFEECYEVLKSRFEIIPEESIGPMMDECQRVNNETINMMCQYAEMKHKQELIDEMRKQFKEQKIKELWSDEE